MSKEMSEEDTKNLLRLLDLIIESDDPNVKQKLQELLVYVALIDKSQGKDKGILSEMYKNYNRLNKRLEEMQYMLDRMEERNYSSKWDIIKDSFYTSNTSGTWSKDE